MQIIRSKYAGACYGVERALALVDEAARASALSASGNDSTSDSARGGNAPLACGSNDVSTTHDDAPTTRNSDAIVHTLGPLIHNPQVVSELRSRGVEEAATVDEVTGGVIVIRSHGVEPAIIEQARAKGLEVVDATCPHVSKAHQAARELRESGHLVIVVGEPGHPEVEGICAYAGDEAIVVQEPNDLPATLPTDKIGIVVQTTQSMAALDTVARALRARGIEPAIKDTICFATRQRQEAATQLAGNVDVMLVVGGRNSGNTTRLTQLCLAVCPRTYHVETAAELDALWLVGAKKVGITAGASTPEIQITAVEQALAEMS